MDDLCTACSHAFDAVETVELAPWPAHASCYPSQIMRRNPLATIIGAELRSGDPRLIRSAIERLTPALYEHAGNLVHVATATGISLRSLQRWQADYPEFGNAITLARRGMTSES